VARGVDVGRRLGNCAIREPLFLLSAYGIGSGRIVLFAAALAGVGLWWQAVGRG